MNNLYDALELCLDDMDRGADVETVLFRFPDLAEDLRPILEASAGARRMAVAAPSPEVVRRNRAKVLQHAAQMREASRKSSQRVWFASIRRLAVALAVVMLLFISGTGLVGAASNTLPGDELYPVKRTWEDVRFLLTFSPQQREKLETARENERLKELQGLFAEGRSEEVDFAGTVTSQNGDQWVISPAVTVILSAQTEVRDGPIEAGDTVRVRGVTQPNGTVLAERIRLLSSGDKRPDVEPEHEIEHKDNNQGPSQPTQDNSGPGSGEETREAEETETPEPGSDNSGNDNSGSDDRSNDNSNDNSDDNSGSGNDNINDGDENSGSDDGKKDDHGDDNSGSGGGDNGDKEHD